MKAIVAPGRPFWISTSIPRPGLPPRRRECGIRRRASSVPSDPYQVLGVTRKMSSDSIQRVYRTKLREAKSAGDEELVNAIEQAHSSLMMQALSQRLQGTSAVSQDIAYADKAAYFPWRPRVCLASRKIALVSAAIQLGLLLYALVLAGSTGTSPAVASAVACAGSVYFKLEKLFPSGAGVAFSADAAERKQGGKNLLRCAAVAVMGTALGVLCFVTLPDLIGTVILHRPPPYWFYDYQETLLNGGVILMSLIMSIFFR